MTIETVDLTKQELCFAEKQPGVIGIFEGATVERASFIGEGLYITNKEIAVLFYGAEYNQEALAYANLFVAAPKLLAACKKVIELLGKGVLVRNIAQDGDANWAFAALSLVQDLNQINQAIALAEGAA